MNKKIIYITPVLFYDNSAASKRILGNAKLFHEQGFDVVWGAGHVPRHVARARLQALKRRLFGS